jgi:hypothetical protein
MVRDLTKVTIYLEPSIVGIVVEETNESIVDVKKVYGSMFKIATFINFKLVFHHIDFNSKVVMEKLMGNNIVKPHLPFFYLPPTKAKVQHSFIQSLRNQFQEIKGIHSKEKLTYKGMLMHVIVNKEVVGVKALIRIFNTNRMNISYVVQKRRMTKLTGSSQWALFIRRKRSDNLDETIVSCVVD